MGIYNNFSFRSVSDYFSVGGEGRTKIREGAARLSSSFSAMRNSAWYKKCTRFDASDLSRRIQSHPRAQQAYAEARQRLAELQVQMSGLIQEIYSKLKQYGIYASHQPHDAERAIHRRWRNVLPPGASILPGAHFDARERVERMEWHSESVKWNATHHVDTGERISVTDWRSGADGWQQREEIEHNYQRRWTTSRREGPPLQHFSIFVPVVPNNEGWFVGMIRDHANAIEWKTYFHPGRQTHYRCTAWSASGDQGVLLRTTYDEVTKTTWHETYNQTNGAHHSRSDWRTAEDGVSRERTAKDHITGEVFVEVNEDFNRTGFFDQEYAGQDLHKLAAESLAALGLEPDERDQSTIKKHYKRLALRRHSDKQVGKSEAEKEAAQREYDQIDRAYKFLSSPAFVQL
ncbi:J domain-containing protein [Herbaspirillum huttiense]|uniref:J domain-containing protein n=2 Tax=Herbaspirillum huttiense TaxID=863372 RepID=A0AAJ2LXX5_9BURK|nr:J domain-containing protein [Herbaspirillum huttiense]MDR9838893.1 J domain-containing protein [Herbaspirillum huttiense]